MREEAESGGWHTRFRNVRDLGASSPGVRGLGDVVLVPSRCRVATLRLCCRGGSRRPSRAAAGSWSKMWPPPDPPREIRHIPLRKGEHRGASAPYSGWNPGIRGRGVNAVGCASGKRIMPYDNRSIPLDVTLPRLLLEISSSTCSEFRTPHSLHSLPGPVPWYRYVSKRRLAGDLGAIRPRTATRKLRSHPRRRGRPATVRGP